MKITQTKNQKAPRYQSTSRYIFIGTIYIPNCSLREPSSIILENINKYILELYTFQIAPNIWTIQHNIISNPLELLVFWIDIFKIFEGLIEPTWLASTKLSNYYAISFPRQTIYKLVMDRITATETATAVNCMLVLQPQPQPRLLFSTTAYI